MTSPQNKPGLFALLVAIDHYSSPVPPLSGCVNDLKKMKGWLRNESTHFGQVQIQTLMNHKATRTTIIDQFQSHLGQASPDDVALFYFSGHGTREEADPVFWTVDQDRKLESLVCIDSFQPRGGKPGGPLLADKELRYLIHQLARKGPHIVAIFDCCHSGGNTRNAYISEQIDDVRERRFINRARLSQAFPARKWQDFIFSDKIPYEKAQSEPITQLLPEGKHIQLAACQNDQSAFEVAGEGVFTKNLLDVLKRSEGAVTYFDLQSRLQNYLKNRFDQTPRIYITGDDESGLFEGFLKKDVESKPLYGNINYNADLGWIMDIGALHGISSRASVLKVRSSDEKREYKAKITQVHPSYTRLSFEETDGSRADDGQPDPGDSLKGYPTDYFSTPLGVYLAIDNDSIREQISDMISSEQSGLHPVSAAYEADYCVQHSDGRLFITRPGTPDVPVILPRKYESESDLRVIRGYLLHLSQYEFVRNLHNPNSYLFGSDPVTVNILKQTPGQGEEPVPVRQGEVNLEYERKNDNGWGGHIRISLKNNTDQKLFCALFYLSFNFGVQVKLLKEVVTSLEPNREAWALDGAPIGLKPEEELQKYNYRESITYLKMIVSTSDFKQQATRFELPPLPKPTSSKPAATRGLELDSYNPGNIEDWTTRLITLKIKNPLYDDQRP